MRLRLFVLAPALVAAAACGGGGDGGADTPAIESSTPDFGSLRGGSRIVLTGEGFLFNGAPPNRVLIGGREAPLAGAIDDEHLEVVVPPHETAGDAEIVVFNSNGFASASGVFRYSAAPSVDSATPDEVPYDETSTITLTGSGFVDEDAGPVTVLIDGEEAIDVEVTSDTELTFPTPAGFVLTAPDITVSNHRGEGTLADAYAYSPGPSGGLLLWPLFNNQTFLVFFDPITLEVSTLPRIDRGGGDLSSYHSVTTDSTGQRIGHRGGQQFQLDEVTIEGQEVDPIGFTTANLADMVNVGGTIYAVDRTSGRFGSVNPSTGAFTAIGTAPLENQPGLAQGTALAADSAGTMYIVHNNAFSTISRTTGALGAPVTLNPPVHVTGMRFVGNTLYAVGRDGNIVTINPSNGVTTAVKSINMSVGAMEFIQ